jgi:hypothetical protein
MSWRQFSAFLAPIAPHQIRLLPLKVCARPAAGMVQAVATAVIKSERGRIWQKKQEKSWLGWQL